MLSRSGLAIGGPLSKVCDKQVASCLRIDHPSKRLLFFHDGNLPPQSAYQRQPVSTIRQKPGFEIVSRRNTVDR
jgi:hypothetical protein